MTRGSERPPLMTRLAASLSGEVAATTIEAYRRAGAAAYEQMGIADAARAEITALGADLWSVSAGRSSQLLCTWNAFALQTLGDALVEADYRGDPRTVGFLPKATAEQSAAFLGQVEPWLTAARRGAADPGFDVATVVALPATLPGWVKVEPCPQSHLDAMLAAARALRARAEAAMADFQRTHTPLVHQPTAATLAGMAADAGSVLSYAESLWSPDAGVEIHERVERALKRAIDAYYTLGQLLAMPMLVGRPRQAHLQPTTGRGRIAPLPGQPAFDPWCLTDRASWERLQQDASARRAITALWHQDPDPAATLAIKAQIDAAVAAGAVVPARMPDGREIGNYFSCPWSPIYVALRPVLIDGVTVHAMQQFAYDVSVDRTGPRAEFVRRLITGPFLPTTDTDYGDSVRG